mgnify:CR=1 FL=1
MTPDGKTFDPETVTDKQLVQYEQAIDRGLTEADAMRLTEHEYNGFQANAIIAAALNPAVGEDVLDALATPKYTAAQMTAIAKIAIRGGDFTRFLDPQMDARRMEAAYLVVAHGVSPGPSCSPSTTSSCAAISPMRPSAPSQSPRLPLRAWRSSPPPWKTHVMTPIPVSTR